MPVHFHVFQGNTVMGPANNRILSNNKNDEMTRKELGMQYEIIKMEDKGITIHMPVQTYMITS